MTQMLFIVDAALAGQRLDKALGAFLPELGLRARRRLWDAKSEGRQGCGAQVLVNGRPRPPGFTVIAGDSIELCMGGFDGYTAPVGPADLALGAQLATVPQVAFSPEEDVWVGNDTPRFLETRDGLLFFHKPAGLHSAALSGGRGGPSLEERLVSLLSSFAASPLNADVPQLLNRLDCGTSGLVVAGCEEGAVLRWREAEDAGLCRKTYVTLLTGALDTELVVTPALDTAQRRVSRVLGKEASPLRHTAFQPLCSVRAEDVAGLMPWAPTLGQCAADQPLTLALCHIRKGARHQIRAHAAHAGYPLWGDARYDDSMEDGKECYVLHHARLDIGDEVVLDPCPWLFALSEKIANNITQSLEGNNFLW